MNTNVAIARQAFRQVRVSATVTALAFGATAASSATTYATSFPTAASRTQLAASTSTNTAISVLLGPITSIDTVGGYTVYKGFVFLTTIGAIWAALAATKLLRGEEDAGRWQLVLAGGTRPAQATAATLAALGAAVALVFAGTAALVALVARDPKLEMGTGEAVVYGLSLAIAPAVFAAIGALAAQLGRTRRQASSIAMGAFAVLFVVRMVADTAPSTRWLLWATPFGWTERMAPFTENNLWPLVPTAISVAALCGASVWLAARRDVGDGVLPARNEAPLRPFGLSSPLGLAARLEVPSLMAWLIGVAATGLVLGILGKIASGDLPDSMTTMLDKFGVQDTFLRQYLGIAFLMAAMVVALIPAGQMAAAAEEETSGRLVHSLLGTTRRRSWFVGRLALAAAAVLVAGVLAGLFTWAGAAFQGLDPGFATTVTAGLNVVPTGLLALGIGAAVLSIRPRAAGLAVYVVVIWSLLVDMVASLVSGYDWLGKLSLFHYMALAPAQDPNVTTVAITLAVAAALCASATVVFDRRDLSAG